MPAVIPTKGNLIAARRSLSLARLGYELMDRKRNILVREMMSLIDRAAVLQTRIGEVFSGAYRALQFASISLGKCDELAQKMPVEDTLTVKLRSIMGVEIPNVSIAPREDAVPYSFSDTNSMLDEAYLEFDSVKRLITELAEVEISVVRLAFAIKKSQKRANSLKNIIIPRLSASIKFMTDALEEKEREEFVRLKVIKAQTATRNAHASERDNA